MENIALAMAIVIETTQREVCSASVRAQYNGLLGRGGTIVVIISEGSISLSTSVFMIALSVYLFSSSALHYCQRLDIIVIIIDSRCPIGAFDLFQLFMISISGVSLFKTNTFAPFALLSKAILLRLHYVLKAILAPFALLLKAI